MDAILLPKNNKIYTDLRTQTSPQGHEFKLSSIRKDLTKPEKWVNGVVKWHWIYLFYYSDGKGFEVELDYNDKFVQLTKI